MALSVGLTGLSALAVEGFLPKRADPWVLDGRIGQEWGGVPSIPLRQGSWLVPNYGPIRMSARPVPPPREEWQGESDLSASVRVAWNEEGLRLGAVIRDDEMVNPFSGNRLPHADSLEIFLDARPGVSNRRDPMATGWNHVLVRPPRTDQPAELAVLSGSIPPDAVRWAAERRSNGWSLEMKIPWSVMGHRHAGSAPGPGHRIGLQVVVNDRDSRDPMSSRPRSMTLNGESPQWEVPQSWLVVFELAEMFPEGPEVPLGPYLALDAPLLVDGSQEELELGVDADEPLRSRIRSLRWELADRIGQPVDVGSMDVTAEAGRPLARWSWSPGELDGHVDWTVTALDEAQRVLGFSRRTLHLTARNLEVMHERVNGAFEQALRDDAPFRAAAVLGAASTLEYYKRAVEMRSTFEMRLAERQFRARLDVLGGARIERPHDDLLSLLQLTALPEAEVTVEYAQLRPGALSLLDSGVVLFRWGSVPMVSVLVENGRASRPYAFLVRDGQLMGSPHPSRPLAERAIELVDRREPVTPEDSDALRRMLVEWAREEGLYDPEQAVEPGKDLELYCGDVHMHTMFSDGRPTPVGLALNGMHAGLDFMVITDHGTTLGAQVGSALLGQHGFAYPLIVGVEYGSHEGFPLHMGIYPLPEGNFPRRLPLEEAVEEARRLGAVTTWNHPGKPDDPWQDEHMPTGLQGLPFDVWENLPPRELYEQWLQEGTLPVMISSSDTHNGIFGASGRALVLASSPEGDALADAVRAGRVGLSAMGAQGYEQERVYYGSAEVVARVWAELDVGTALRERKAAQWRTVFSNADLAGLLRASPPHTVSLESVLAAENPEILPPLVDPATLAFSIVDLSDVVNRSLADDKANDGQGGWTDQGPGWDLRELRTGRQEHEGVPYLLLTPRTCVVLNAPSVRPQSRLPDAVDIEVDALASMLYFLHSGAWVGAGETHWTYEIAYADGTIEAIPVVGGVNVRDWGEAGVSGGFPASDALRTTVWPQRVETLLSPTSGLFVMEWRNPRPETRIKRIRMRAEPGGGVPILLAITRGHP